MSRILPVNSLTVASLNANDLEIKTKEFSIVGKYIVDPSCTTNVNKDSKEEEDGFHAHRFYVQDSGGQVHVTYNFDCDDEFAFSFTCKLCNNSFDASDCYVRVSRAQLISLQGKNGLRTNHVEIIAERGEKLQNRLKHHELCTQNHHQWSKQTSNPTSFEAVNVAIANSKISNPIVSAAVKYQTDNNNKDAIEKQFADYDSKFYPLLRVFKAHMAKHQGHLSIDLIEQYLNQSSSILIPREELEALVLESCDFGLFYDQDQNGEYYPSFTFQ